MVVDQAQELEIQGHRHGSDGIMPAPARSPAAARRANGAVPVITLRQEVPMARMVKCAKLQRELPGLEFKPFPNELGQRIYESISQEAWKMWLEHFKMIMNEYRLAGGSEQANQVLFDQAEKYFFGEGAALPPDYKPPQAKG
jgi:Fe-S cluster biosynthesis and repair protein YggX